MHVFFFRTPFRYVVLCRVVLHYGVSCTRRRASWFALVLRSSAWQDVSADRRHFLALLCAASCHALLPALRVQHISHIRHASAGGRPRHQQYGMYLHLSYQTTWRCLVLSSSCLALSWPQSCHHFICVLVSTLVLELGGPGGPRGFRVLRHPDRVQDRPRPIQRRPAQGAHSPAVMLVRKRVAPGSHACRIAARRPAEATACS